MARKARQGARPKKKQVRSRIAIGPEPKQTAVTPESEPERAPVTTFVPAAPTAERQESTGRRPVAGSRTTTPYQHRRGRQVATVRSAARNAFTLPREQEYAFIRADLRRLLITAAVLAVMMVALLVLLQP